MGLLRLVAPSEFPVSTDEVITRLRMDDESDSAAVERLISAATRAVENKTQRALVTQKWEFITNGFPNSQHAHCDGYFLKNNSVVISLPLPPLQSVESITYIDINGVEQILSPSDYVVDKSTYLGSVFPAFGKSWPAVRNQPMSVRIAFTAGYGAAAEVEPDLVLGILLLVAHYDQNREAVSDRQMFQLPHGVDALLGPYVVPSAP